MTAMNEDDDISLAAVLSNTAKLLEVLSDKADGDR